MTNTTIALNALAERGADIDVLRQIMQFMAQRLMAATTGDDLVYVYVLVQSAQEHAPEVALHARHAVAGEDKLHGAPVVVDSDHRH